MVVGATMKTAFKHSVILLSFIFLLSACGGGGATYSLLPQASRFHQNGTAFNNKLDILFVINDQPSMSSFQAELVSSMSSFMNVFQAKGFDFKIAVATSAAYMADPTLNSYNAVNISAADFNDFNGTVYSGFPVLLPDNLDLLGNFGINAQPNKNTAGQDGRSFSSMRQALNSSRPRNSGFLRGDSYLAVIIVDNQDDFSGNARCTGCNVNQRYNSPNLDAVSVYKDFLGTVTGTSGSSARFNVSAMTQSAQPCQGGQNMTRIMDLVTSTNGIIGDICQADFGASMAQISNQIAQLSTQFFLPTQPVVATISVVVDGSVISNDTANGWTYDSVANSIVFHGTSIPQQGAVVDVNYDPTTVL